MSSNLHGSPLIAFDNVGKAYRNGVRALEGFSLTIPRGAFVSLLGPSGCGKSTALRLMAGLGAPTSGSIRWLDGKGEARRHVGFVFQEPTLMPWATVSDNVRIPLRIEGVDAGEARRRVDEVLELVRLRDFSKAYPRELSGGMKMRTSIARVVVTRPDILLLDEPFAALDEPERFRLNRELLELWQRFGWTVVFVTHSVFESVYLSERVVVMTPRPGRVAAEIAVPLPYPRDPAVRMSVPYNELCRTVSATLEQSGEGAR